VIDPDEQPAGAEIGFVLLHGAMLGRWLWERVVPDLAGPALAIDFPGRGAHPADVIALSLGDVIDSVAADVDSWPTDRVVLVAHSLSGIVVPALISRLAGRVAHVVFVSAAVPRPGVSYLDALPFLQRMPLRFVVATQRRGVLSPAWATRRALCNDLDEQATSLVLDNVTREVPRMYTDPVPGEVPAAMPTVYVKLTSDRAFSPAMQDRMIARLHEPRIEEVDAGHLPMLGHPDRLTAICNAALERARS
jgi:pimeloyl-ACP methyl ester carboxylesterase